MPERVSPLVLEPEADRIVGGPLPFTSLANRLEMAARGPVTVVPGELAPVVAADLPLRGRARKREALSFALEDGLAVPLERLHFALGPAAPLPDRPARHLAVAMDRDAMAACGTAAPVLSEVLGVPAPIAAEDRPVWAVWAEDGRAVIRCADGTGFVAGVGALPALWRMAGQPRLLRLADPLPQELPAEDLSDDPPPAATADTAFDHRQGAFAPEGSGIRPHLRFAAGLVAATIAVHTGLAAADLLALRDIAAVDRARAGAAVAAHLPEAPDLESMEAAALARLNGGAETAPPSLFLSLLTRTVAALERGNGLSIRRMSFDAANERLTLLVEGPDLDGLQRAEQALAAAGLTVESGAAVARNGAAEAEFRIRGGRR